MVKIKRIRHINSSNWCLSLPNVFAKVQSSTAVLSSKSRKELKESMSALLPYSSHVI